MSNLHDKLEKSLKSVVVVGSTNVDLVMKVENLPLPGETVGNGVFVQTMGGKGANQAVAVSRLGGQVSFISAVGNDSFGVQARTSMGEQGISVESVVELTDVATGTALIFVDDQGENVIGVAPGANGQLTIDHVEQHRALFADAAMVLFQLEIPINIIAHAIDLAHQEGAPIVLNAAPFTPDVLKLLPKLSTLIVNQIEAKQIYDALMLKPSQPGLAETSSDLGDKPVASNREVEEHATAIRLIGGVDQVVITLGADGVFSLDSSGGSYMKAEVVEVVDTTGAGDTFCGALVTELSRGATLTKAIEFAQKAAAIAVTKLGAQAAIPMRSDLEPSS